MVDVGLVAVPLVDVKLVFVVVDVELVVVVVDVGLVAVPLVDVKLVFVVVDVVLVYGRRRRGARCCYGQR